MEILKKILLRPLGRIHTVLLATGNKKKARLLEGIARAPPVEVFSFAAIASIPNALVVSGNGGFPAFVGALLLSFVAVILPAVIVATLFSHKKKESALLASALAHGTAPLVLLSWMLVKYPVYYIVGLAAFWGWSVIASGRLLQKGMGGNVKRNVRLAMLGNVLAAVLLYGVSALIYAKH